MPRGQNNRGRSNNQGRNENGQFTEGSEAAKKAGRKGGKTAQQRGTAHEFSREERERGGENSSGGGRND